MLISEFEKQANFSAEQSKNLDEIFQNVESDGPDKTKKVRKTKNVKKDNNKENVTQGNLFINSLSRYFKNVDNEA